MMNLIVSGAEYEEFDNIPEKLERTFLDVNDNKLLDYNNENLSKLVLFKFDKEKKDVNIRLECESFVGKIVFMIGEDCDINVKFLGLQDKIGVSNVDFLVVLNRNSKFNLDSLSFASGEGIFNLLGRVFSMNSGNKARINLKAVSRNSSRIYNEAAATIGSKASKTDFNVSEKGLIFDNSKIEFYPNLKIDTNEVVAGHSAHVKKFAADDLFYLMSRGVSLEDSRNLLVHSFLDEFSNFELNKIF